MAQSTHLNKILVQLLCLPIFCATMELSGEIPAAALQVFPPMNVIYHPVSTTNPQAQKHFDTGLTYIYAYNHDLAFREFEAAAKLDPELAMAYWGMALALGQNVNEDVTPERELLSYGYIQKALKLSENATQTEKDYISALSTRYTDDPSADFVPLRFKYRDAMKQLIQKYPEDLDAAAIYSESILELDPWKWWSPEGKPLEGTIEAIDVLEFILLRNPDHIGANHYYIHAWEESPTPQRALVSAYRLQTLLPESGHLVHMSNHIFLQTGNYEQALSASNKAIAQDRDYIKKYGMDAGPYPRHYLTHNLYVLTRTYMLMEDYENAIKAAMETLDFIKPFFATVPHATSKANVPLEVYLYFNKWKEILDYPLLANAPSVEAYWHYSRATAFAELGDLDSAQKEKELMLQAKDRIESHEQIANNPASKVLELATVMLDSTFARVNHEEDNYLSLLKKGANLQDQLFYDEPPAWQTPVRQLLGFAYLQRKQYVEAEAAFRKVLNSLQRNGRTLFGLYLSLKGQGRDQEAYLVEREMKAALKYSTSSFQIPGLNEASNDLCNFS